MRLQRILGTVCLMLGLSVNGAAQDQTIIIEQPFKLCGTPQQFALGSFDESKAVELIRAALGVDTPDPATYYIIHATEFVPSRMIVAAERWYVYHQPWQQKPPFWWFRDSRQFKRFREARILGSSRVALVYLYLNVPTYASRSAIGDLQKFFLERRQKGELQQDQAEHEALTESSPRLTTAQREAAVQSKRTQRLQALRVSMQDELPPAAEAEAVKRAGSSTTDLNLIAWLEAERYLKALAEQRSAFTSEFELVNRDTGDRLTGLSPTLATTAAYESLANLFYRIDVTKKLPAPVRNLKEAAKLAFQGQSAAARLLGVEVVPSAVCAGREAHVDHIPSDLLVKALVAPAGADAATERTSQTFDNEGKYWWDVSFGLPVNLRRDLTIDVDAGQVAAKDVQKSDLFVLANLGMPRDTKRIQWQLVPTIVYGIPITGKPLKHHLLGFTIGLNYVQLLGGVRFDRRQVVGITVDNGTPVGVESTPAGDKWEHQWVWGINLPVNTVVKIFTK